MFKVHHNMSCIDTRTHAIVTIMFYAKHEITKDPDCMDHTSKH